MKFAGIEIDKDTYLYIRDKVHKACHRSKKAKMSSDITMLWVEQQLLNQRWRCFYTGNPLVMRHSLLTLSFDRIDNDEGYLQNNTIICNLFVNRARNDMPFDDFYVLAPTLFTQHPSIASTLDY